MNAYDSQKTNNLVALHSLRGILNGIQADEELSEIELMYLSLWLQTHQAFGNSEWLKPLMDTVLQIKQLGQLSETDLTTLRKYENVIENEFNNGSTLNDGVNLLTSPLEHSVYLAELIGFLEAISVDSHLHALEITALEKWVKKHAKNLEHWSTQLLSEELERILEDGVITESERISLLDTCKTIIQKHREQQSHQYQWTTSFLEDTSKTVSFFNGLRICFAGDFISGSKTWVEGVAQRLGACIEHHINHKTDMLVIGYHQHEDWRLTQLELFIEKAVRLREQGYTIKIFNEQTWIEHITLLQE